MMTQDPNSNLYYAIVDMWYNATPGWYYVVAYDTVALQTKSRKPVSVPPPYGRGEIAWINGNYDVLFILIYFFNYYLLFIIHLSFHRVEIGPCEREINWALPHWI